MKAHDLMSFSDSYGISPRYREVLIYLGQESCYEKGSEELELLLGLKSNAAQIQRLSCDYGHQVESILDQASDRWELASGEVVYGQADGSMLFTREQGWQEVKIGRTFPASSLAQVSKNRCWAQQSEYVAHLGKHTDFEIKMSRLLDKYEDLGPNLVFISDGASWIANWIKAEYPQATMILDIFHAREYLSEFLETYFGKQDQIEHYQKWSEQLCQEGGKAIMDKIKALPTTTQKAEIAREKILQYYGNNAYRMNYPNYLKRGLQVGSGAIEAAHRTVAQKRMKLSGQRWSQKGAQAILNLRTLRMSGRWNELQNMLRAA